MKTTTARYIGNALKNALGVGLGVVIGLPVFDIDGATWKKAAGGALGSLLLTAYNWATPTTAPGRMP